MPVFLLNPPNHKAADSETDRLPTAERTRLSRALRLAKRSLCDWDFRGAGDRFRTDDLVLGKHTLYQLSYTRPGTEICNSLRARGQAPRSRGRVSRDLPPLAAPPLARSSINRTTAYAISQTERASTLLAPSYLITTGFTGEPAPPTILSGAPTKRNVYWPSLAQSSARSVSQSISLKITPW